MQMKDDDLKPKIKEVKPSGIVYDAKSILDVDRKRKERRTKMKKKCKHNRLYAGSGGYYIFCKDCPMSWTCEKHHDLKNSCADLCETIDSATEWSKKTQSISEEIENIHSEPVGERLYAAGFLIECSFSASADSPLCNFLIEYLERGAEYIIGDIDGFYEIAQGTFNLPPDVQGVAARLYTAKTYKDDPLVDKLLNSKNCLVVEGAKQGIEDRE